MDCIILILMLVFGIMAMVKGQVPVGGSRVCYGTPARLVGGVLIATGLLIFGANVAIGAYFGFNAAKTGKPFDPMDILPISLGVDCGMLILGLLIAFGIAYANAEPRRQTKFGDDDAYRRRLNDPRDRDDYEEDTRRRHDDDGPPDDRIRPERP